VEILIVVESDLFNHNEFILSSLRVSAPNK
jgi:hypothetical protein